MAEISKYFPELQTGRLFLRNICDEDIDFVFCQFSDPLVTQYLMDEPPVATMDEAKAIIDFYHDPESKNRNRWVIIRKTDQRVIGTCGFHKWEKAHRRAEVGYDLAADCWGQGYMTEAMHAVINNGFTRMELNRIDALVHVDNPRSNDLLQKLGFTREGVLRDYFCLNGTFYDHNIFGLLRRDWQG